VSLRDHPPDPLVGRGGRAWRVEEILDELDPEDREALEAWLRDLRFSPEKIVAELRVEGISCSDSAIAKYRFEKLGLGKRKR
jgi:hypothetical protein